MTILDEAHELTSGDRNDAYGHPADDYKRTAGMWSAWLGTEITALQAQMMMAMVKISRLRHSPEHRDSLVDLAGYARTYEMTLNGSPEKVKSLIYLASPYSPLPGDADPDELRSDRFEAVNEYCARMHKAGLIYYSPITSSHMIAKTGLVPDTFEAWLPFDLQILSRCDRLWVLRLMGWGDSRGVRAEIEHAEKLGIPITYVDPGAPIP